MEKVCWYMYVLFLFSTGKSFCQETVLSTPTIVKYDMTKAEYKSLKHATFKYSKLDEAKISKANSVYQSFRSKYPVSFLKYLPEVYFFDTLIDKNGQSIGGSQYQTKSGSWIIVIAYHSHCPPYLLERILHHEFSHIIEYKFYSEFDWKQWEKIGGSTKRDLGGIGAIKNGAASQEFDPELNKMGFLHQYAMSSPLEDATSIIENYFVPETDFWDIIDSNVILERKAIYIVNFYQTLDTTFTLEYFKQFKD